jgi:hypothetical protein
MRRRTALLLYLVLNILLSAATTLVVLTLWERARQAEQPAAAQLPAGAEPAQRTAAAPEGEPTPAEPAEAQPPLATETLPPPDQTVIEIVSVVAPGDLEYEVVLLRRLGDGNLRMTGWRLESESGASFVFPAQPELVLYKDGAVQVYTKSGADTATEVYWNRSEPAWRSGETVQLIDTQGNRRAVYRVP